MLVNFSPVIILEDDCFSPIIIFIAMLDHEDAPEDKGLFTFYREQAEREDEIKREKKNRKKRKEQEMALKKL